MKINNFQGEQPNVSDETTSLAATPMNVMNCVLFIVSAASSNEYDELLTVSDLDFIIK